MRDVWLPCVACHHDGGAESPEWAECPACEQKRNNNIPCERARRRQLKTQRRAFCTAAVCGPGIPGWLQRTVARQRKPAKQGLPTMARRLLFLHALVASNAEFERRSGTGDCVASSLRAHSLECGWWLDSSLLADWRSAQQTFGLADTAASNLEAAGPGVVRSALRRPALRLTADYRRAGLCGVQLAQSVAPS